MVFHSDQDDAVPSRANMGLECAGVNFFHPEVELSAPETWFMRHEIYALSSGTGPLQDIWNMDILIVQSLTEEANRWNNLLAKFNRNLTVVSMTSVAETVQWLADNPGPDLLMCETILPDGNCFDILCHFRVTFPVVFMGDPRETLSIGLRNLGLQFLPLSADEQVVGQFLSQLSARRINGTSSTTVSSIDKLTGFRRRFLVKHGQRWLSINIEDVAWFHSEDKVCTIRTRDRKRYIIDFTLDELAQMIDPTQYFRVNRNYILHVDSIKSFAAHFGGKLILETEPVAEGEQILVSQEKAQKFKVWLGK